MGFYKDGKYVYEPTDVGCGVCSDKEYQKQRRNEEKKREQNNSGMADTIKGVGK